MQIDRAKVKRQMRKKGIKHFADVAAAVGVTRQSMARWFAGDQFSSTSLQALTDALDCTPNDVLVWDEDQPSEAQPSEAQP